MAITDTSSQNGRRRHDDSLLDVGAFEYSDSTIVAPPGIDPDTGGGGGSGSSGGCLSASAMMMSATYISWLIGQ